MTAPWSERVARARVVGKFTEEDKVAVREWATCATCAAEISTTRMREPGLRDIPEDVRLASLGVSFTFAVEDDRTDRASELHAAIRARAAALKGTVAP